MRITAALAFAGVAAAGSLWAGRVIWQTWADLEPERQPVDPALRARLGSAEDVTLRTSDGLELRGWYAPSRNGAALIIVHGLDGSRTQFLRTASGVANHGYGVLVFDSRAHGESQGRRTSLGWHEQRDVDAAVGFVAHRPEVDQGRVAALGFSVGGMALALHAARDPRLAAVVLAGTFASLEEMVRIDEPGPRGRLALWTLGAVGVDQREVRPEDVLCRLQPRPILLAFGTADPAVQEVPRLLARACGPARVVLLPGARHGNYDDAAGGLLEQELVRFLDETLRR